MKRILVIKLSSLGDIAHALPALRALKDRTGAAIDWVVQPEYAALAACCLDADRVIEFPRREMWRRLRPFLRELRRERYEAIVDLQGLMKSALVARLARGDRRYGPAWAREGAPLFYDIRPPRRAGPRGHAVGELMEVVDLVAPGGREALSPLRLHLPEAEPHAHPGPHVAFAPFSRWGTKDWPLENFAELGRRLMREMGCQIRIVGGGADAEKGEALAGQIGEGARSLCGHTDLPGLCALLKNMDLLVTVDSGPMHWADAMDVPLVAIFGATDPARTGPYRQLDHVVAQDGLSCRPCHARTCARGDLACLRTLDVETVFRAALERL